MTMVMEPERASSQEQSKAQPAEILACLPNAMFRIRTKDGQEHLAHVAGDLRMKVTRLLPGDVVLVECSPFDRSKARICGLAAGR